MKALDPIWEISAKTIIPDSEGHPPASSRAVPKDVLRWIRGKAKKSALTACMRKLLVILNSMIRYGTSWEEPISSMGALAS